MRGKKPSEEPATDDTSDEEMGGKPPDYTPSSPNAAPVPPITLTTAN